MNNISTNVVIFNVIKNIIKMIKYRNQTIIGEPLTDAKILSIIGSFSYIQIPTIKNNRQNIYIIVSPDSYEATKSQNFQKMIESVGDILISGCDITIVLQNTLSSNLLKKLNKLRQTYPATYLEYVPYKIFHICIPEHNLCVPHRIASKEEIDYYCDFIKTTPDDFPIIRVDDPMAIWIGARKNDVVAIIRTSENVGEHTFYRICK